MKRWRLLFEFYQKNGIAVLFLLLMMTVSLFFFVQFLGYLGYQTYSLRIMDQLGFQDGAYFMAPRAMTNGREMKTSPIKHCGSKSFRRSKA